MNTSRTHVFPVAMGLLLISCVFGLTWSEVRAQNATDDTEDAAEALESSLGANANITEAKARTLAEEAYKGTGKLTDIHFERYNGYIVYAVEFTEDDGNEVDVKLDSETGAILRVESDRTETGTDDTEDADASSTSINPINSTGSTTVSDESSLLTTLVRLLNELLSILQNKGT